MSDIMSSPSTRKQVLYEKTKDGHQKIVSRFQRRMMEEKVLKEEEKKLEIQRKLNQYLNYSSLVETVKSPIKSPTKSPYSTVKSVIADHFNTTDVRKNLFDKDEKEVSSPSNVIRENVYDAEEETEST
jgi:hypothetical protein